MKFPFTSILLVLVTFVSFSQQQSVLSGIIVDDSGNLLTNATIYLEASQEKAILGASATFELTTSLTGNHMLHITAPGYIEKRLAIDLNNTAISLGRITLKRDITIEKADNLITLTENDLSDDNGSVSSSLGLLQATRDVFLKRAAFDFSQAFFRVRGYGSEQGDVLINGIRMNKLFNGRPDWNNWGGLNDIARNQEFANGLEAFDYGFGGVLGNTNILTRPSNQRAGYRFSTSASNRNYHGRIMATYTATPQNGFAYTLSASKRWANEGYIDGTLYDAYSFFGSMEVTIGKTQHVALTAIMAKNRRGRSSAVTEEVFELKGNRYNPYWGPQNGEIRNARERTVFQPIVMLNHYLDTDKFKLTSGIAYQFGAQKRGRLGYFNAANPDPTYYRYLPSFYINNRIGADFTNAALARDGFLQNPQINWPALYTANSSPENAGKASYVQYDDVANDTQWTVSSVANIKLGQGIRLDIGGHYQQLKSENYAEIHDLLGAEFHEDIDPFSTTLNDVQGNLAKVEGDIFNYRYRMDATLLSGFGQLHLNRGNWNSFLSGKFETVRYQRTGLFQNERFLSQSIGPGDTVNFGSFAFKSGLTYKISGRHWLKAHAAYLTQAPLLQNSYVNPRERNEVVFNLQEEVITSLDVNYLLRLPKLTGRLTGFYTRFQDITDINFFFVDSGVGSDFVQEVLTDIDKLHQGVEFGLEYELSPTVKLSLAGVVGRYAYASNPNVTINFDTAGAEEDLIDPQGSIDLGLANIKGLKLPQGPQQALSLGIEYRDPDYWWVGATANHLANTYAAISTITRTESFVLDPDTGNPFPGATPENVQRLLAQRPLDDFYLLNFVGGKSWLKNGKYISLFASVNNAFNETFRTGGYEQSRNGNYGQLLQDTLRDNPSFAPKYWYGFGRTYFINLAISF